MNKIIKVFSNLGLCKIYLILRNSCEWGKIQGVEHWLHSISGKNYKACIDMERGENWGL